MWTLRDLWMYLNPEYAQKFREQRATQIGNFREGNPAYWGNDAIPWTLEDTVKYRSPGIQNQFRDALPNIWTEDEYDLHRDIGRKPVYMKGPRGWT